MKFTEAQLEQAIIELLGRDDHPHVFWKNLWPPDRVQGDGRSKSLPLSVIPAEAGIQCFYNKTCPQLEVKRLDSWIKLLTVKSVMLYGLYSVIGVESRQSPCNIIKPGSCNAI